MDKQDLLYGQNGALPSNAPYEKIYAKKHWNGKWDEYWVRHATSGPDVPHLLNPWGVNYRPGDDKRFDSHTGKRIYEFKKVSKAVFDMYVKFLETGSDAYYRNAERALD